MDWLDSELLLNAGTSEGVRKAWETRRGGGSNDALPAGRTFTSSETSPGHHEGEVDGSKFSLRPARYAKGNMALTVEGKDGYKTRGAYLVGPLNARYSGRENAYIMSPAKAEVWKTLAAKGYDGGSFGDTIHHTNDLMKKLKITRAGLQDDVRNRDAQPFHKLFNGGCGCDRCADTEAEKKVEDSKLVNDEDEDDTEMENGGYRSIMSAIRNSRLASLSEGAFKTKDDPESLAGLAEVGKQIKERKIWQESRKAKESFVNRGVAGLFNSQPCGDSHIPDGATCHVGQGASASSTSRDASDGQANERNLSQKHEERYIASTILDQIKATDRSALGAWGTRNPTIMPAGKVGEDGYQRGGVQFKVNGGKLGHGIVKVRLMANDTYTVETGKVRMGQWKPQGKRDEVYADSLMETIDHMVERDRPGYSNRYHAALEAMVNAGTTAVYRHADEVGKKYGLRPEF